MTTPSPFQQNRGSQMPLTLPGHLWEPQGTPPPPSKTPPRNSQPRLLPARDKQVMSFRWPRDKRLLGWRIVFPATAGEWFWLRGPNFEDLEGWKVWDFPGGILGQLLEQGWRGEAGRKKPRGAEKIERQANTLARLSLHQLLPEPVHNEGLAQVGFNSLSPLLS